MGLKLKRNIVENYQAGQTKSKPYTILLVDDEEANIEGLASILSTDYNILTAVNGEDAVELVQSLQPPEKIHLIISDQRMPKMTGVELFEQIIPIMPDSIRMILTGFTDINAIIDAINRGAVYKFLTKPIEPVEMRVTVQRALESLELTQKNNTLMKELVELNNSLEHKVVERTRQLAEKQQALENANTELKQQITLVERLSITDELTQLYNRRHFNNLFPKEIQRAARSGIPLSFFMLDVDHFKQYNDNYGHQKGDEVLKTIGKILNHECSRASDFPLRLGGEEFGIIFSGLNSEEALIFANKVKLAIEASKMEHLFSSVAKHVTASFGLITSTTTQLTLDMDAFYKQADNALYQAKEQGRNCIIQVK